MLSAVGSRILAVLVAAAVALSATGCAGGKQPADPREALLEVKQTLDSSAGVHLVVTGNGVPTGLDALLSADGTATRQPAFTGRLVARSRVGLELSAQVVSVNNTTFAKPAFKPGWLRLDPAKYGLPDPARMIDPAHGLTSLLPATSDPVYGKRSRQGRQVLSEVSGTLAASSLAPLFSQVGPQDRFAVTYRLDLGRRQLVSIHLTGPFYGRQICSYDVTLDAYGVAPTVTPPNGVPAS